MFTVKCSYDCINSPYSELTHTSYEYLLHGWVCINYF